MIPAENLSQAAGKAATSCGGKAEDEEKIKGSLKSQKNDRGAARYPGAGGQR